MEEGVKATWVVAVLSLAHLSAMEATAGAAVAAAGLGGRYHVGGEDYQGRWCR